MGGRAGREKLLRSFWGPRWGNCAAELDSRYTCSLSLSPSPLCLPTSNALLISFRLSPDAGNFVNKHRPSTRNRRQNVQKRGCNVCMFQPSFQFACRRLWLGPSFSASLSCPNPTNTQHMEKKRDPLHCLPYWVGKKKKKTSFCTSPNVQRTSGCYLRSSISVKRSIQVANGVEIHVFDTIAQFFF